MTLAERAKQQVPNSPDVSDTLGYVYYQKNLNTEALQIFRAKCAAVSSECYLPPSSRDRFAQTG